MALKPKKAVQDQNRIKEIADEANRNNFMQYLYSWSPMGASLEEMMAFLSLPMKTVRWILISQTQHTTRIKFI